MMKHLGTSLLVALLAALASAFAVLWLPTLAGRAVTGAALAWWCAHTLRKHKLARKGTDAMLAGALAVVAALVFLPAAVPLAVFVILALPSVAHHANPKRPVVVRTTRGVKSPAKRAAGGRAGRPGEKIPAARRARASAPRSPARTPEPAPARTTPQKPSESRVSSSPSSSWPPPVPGPPPPASWPHASGDVRPSTFLPLAGEGTGGWGTGSWGTGSARPKRLRPDEHRPGAVARGICGACLTGCCPDCADRGCECPGGPHGHRPGSRPAYVPPAIDPDEPVPF